MRLHGHSPARTFALLFCTAALLVASTGCVNKKATTSKAAIPLKRTGQEIMVAGQLFDIGTPVVLWTDPGGFDAYRTERRFSAWEDASFQATTRAATTQKSIEISNPARVRIRQKVLTPAEIEIARGGMPLEMVQDKVDQFVLHYDVAGTSASCFRVLHDNRALSVQLMLDIDGTIYQTCDLKDAAAHATKANDRSVGIEIANLGSYGSGEPPIYKRWYGQDEKGPYITVPESLKKYIRTPNFVGRPARPEMVIGEIRGRQQRQYDYTPEQYEALVKLTAGLCTVLPKIKPDYPRGQDGQLLARTLTPGEYDNYQGVLGHYHVQTNKSDPGVAFQWDYVIDGARKRMGLPTKSMSGTVVPEPETQPAGKPASATTQPAQVSSVNAVSLDVVESEMSLRRRLDDILSRKNTGDTHYVSRVIELESGRELYAHDIDKPVAPASNMKLPVSAAVLDRFGSSHKFQTFLAMDGDDLWLIGTGDPACGDPKLAKQNGNDNGKPTDMLDKWAAALKAKGISQIKGNLYYYADTFDDETIASSWSKGYLTDWYAAPVTGLNFNDNCIDVTVKPTTKGQPTSFTVMPAITSTVKVSNGITTREGDGPAPEISRPNESNDFKLSGATEKQVDLESKCVTDPAAFFADALRTHLASSGIKIEGETKRADKPLAGLAIPPADKVVAVHETPMPDIMWRINKSSQNLFAEAACKYLGRQFKADNGVDERGSWKNGGEAVHAFLKRNGIDDSKFVVADGSGLSRDNRVTARLQSDLLVVMSKHKEADAFRNSLAEGGKDGTIGKRFSDLPARVFAKTGYIGGVRSLSGYVKTKQDKWIVFSIIYNGIDGNVKPYEELQDEAVRLLAEWPNLPAAKS